jgi:hypothetical protein
MKGNYQFINSSAHQLISFSYNNSVMIDRVESYTKFHEEKLNNLTDSPIR